MSILKKPKTEIRQLDILTKHERKLQKFYQELTSEVAMSARNDAKHNPPAKEVPIEHLPETHKTKSSCSKEIAGIAKTEKGTLDITLSDYLQADSKLNNSQSRNSRIDDLRTGKKEENAKLEQDVNKRDEILGNNEADLKDKLKHHKLDLQITTKHALALPVLAFFVLAGVIAGGDVTYVATAFELTGLSYFEKYVVAISVGLSTIFIGVGVVEFLRSKWNNLWKIIGVVSGFLLICGGYLVLGKIRVDLMYKEMASGVEFSNFSAYDFLLINLIFFVAIVLIHWLIWPSKSKFSENSQYKNVQNEVAQTGEEIKIIQKERSNLSARLIKEQSNVNTIFDKNIAEIETEFNALESKRAESLTIFNNIYGRLIEMYDEINFFYKETVGLYITTMNKYRNDGVFLIMNEPLEDLPNPFASFKYMDDDTSAEMKTTDDNYSEINIDFDELLTNTNTKNHENTPFNN